MTDQLLADALDEFGAAVDLMASVLTDVAPAHVADHHAIEGLLGDAREKLDQWRTWVRHRGGARLPDGVPGEGEI